MMEIENSRWKIPCQSKPKLRNYIKYKNHLETETYVTCNLNRKERSYVAQTRLGILPIQIETGRFSKLPLNERICEFCTSAEIEDEAHFLFRCENYTRQRDAFLNKIGIHHDIENISSPEFTRLIFTSFPRQVSKYIISIFDIRKSQLYTS